MFGRFEIVDRQRPVALLAPGAITLRTAEPSGAAGFAQPAPYAALVADLAGSGPAHLSLASGDTELTGRWDPDASAAEITLTRAGVTTQHRSRARGRLAQPPARLALSLTGEHLTLFSASEASDTDEAWVVRARVDLGAPPGGGAPVPVRDPAWLDGLRAHWHGVRSLAGGGFGQLGLRDLRFASESDGTPVRVEGALLLTATHAGPGFFDTAHTGVWSLDPHSLALRHRGDLFFRRPDRPEVYGDHSTHLVRDGDRWLVATSTWGDFAVPPGVRGRIARRRRGQPPVDPARSRVEVTLAETGDDLTQGRHVLATRRLTLPTRGRSVAVWDPHLVRDGDGWLVGYVSARRFFDFHPVLAEGPDLDRLSVRGEDARRCATEGTTVVRGAEGWLVAASDGPDGRAGQRGRYPLFDLDMREVGSLEAPHPTNIPWPNLARVGDGWLLATFDGTRWPGAAPVVGYGTHGDVVLLRTRAEPAASHQA